MPAVGFCKNFFDVPLSNVASVGLIETDLQFAPKSIVDQLLEIILGDKHIDLPGLFVLHLDGGARMIEEGLSLFIGQFGDHAVILPDL
jgi:hypothetical protein